MNQRTLLDVENKVNELIDKEFTFKVFGVKHTMDAGTLGYRFQFDNAKNRFGACHYRKRVISLSRPICAINLDKLETKITDTILHELAHAFSVYFYGTEGKGHGSHWRSIALAIGCDGQRCYDGKKINQPKSKYTLVCPNGCQIPTHRARKRTSSCGRCGNGSYDSSLLLKQVQNY